VISLRRALAIADRHHAGARAVDISFDGTSGSPIYRVKTFKGPRVWEDAIDAITGEIVGPSVESELKSLQNADRRNLKALKAVRLEIDDAVLVAERSASGSAISGGLTNENGKLSFVIVVVSGKELKQVVLEPPTARSRGLSK
jgi:uncharacterized membrane protein YkoI